MNVYEFNTIMNIDYIQPVYESYEDMLSANEAAIESFENLLKEFENTETRINENYYNSSVKEAVKDKSEKVKKSTTNIVDKLKNQRDYLKKKIQSKNKKKNSSKSANKLKEFAKNSKDVDFKESTILLKRYCSDRQTESCIRTMENLTNKMSKLSESYSNTKDSRYLNDYKDVYREYKDFYNEASKYLNVTSEVRLNSTLIENAVNILINEDANILELRKEYDNLIGKLQSKAVYNGKVLESFSDAKAAELNIYPTMIDTYQLKLSKLNSDIANANKIIEAASEFDDELYENYIDYEDEMLYIQEGQNMDIYIETARCKKEFRRHIKAAKSYIKSGNNSEAKKEVEQCKVVVKNLRKTLVKFDRSDFKSNLLGTICGGILYMAKNMIWILPVCTVDQMVGGSGTIPQIMGFVKGIIDGCNTMMTNIRHRNGSASKGIDFSGYNNIYNDCLMSLDKMNKGLDKIIKEIDKKGNSKNESSWLDINDPYIGLGENVSDPPSTWLSF